MENNTKIYKRRPSSKINKISIEAKEILTKLGIEHRVEQLNEGNTYITVKYHTEELPKKPSFRLINPSKSEIGKISKILPKLILSGYRIN